MNHYNIFIRGLVQGVGFRPFIYNLALAHNLKGYVKNNNEGVEVLIHSDENIKQNFINDIYRLRPIASNIESITINKISDISKEYKEFNIIESCNISFDITNISPDIAVCEECLMDMKNQDSRVDYPFINCTKCGPRFSIIQSLPYDRPKTSMHKFQMCQKCFSEYVDRSDRRFHAQPTACNDCGPVYSVYYNRNDHLVSQIINSVRLKDILSSELNNGRVISIKGLGGFNIMCNAFDDKAVRHLREIKKRDNKPFALMFRDINAIEKYLHINKEEKSEIQSWRRPILLLKTKYDFNPDINDGLNTIGAILPYMPIHYLLFEHFKSEAIIFTSGNYSDAPIIKKNDEAIKCLLPFTDIHIDNNREIINQCDDSIVQIIDNKPTIIRRSRGYVPEPYVSSLKTEGILACGAQMNSTFVIGKGNKLIQSQYIGDLSKLSVQNSYQDILTDFEKLFRFKPSKIICDLHPDYFSSLLAEKIADQFCIPLFKAQHHHAHAVACMEEHNLSGNILSVILDGSGYGPDNKIWGGEFLICDKTLYKRVDHFKYIPLPGNEKAVKEPWRMAIAYSESYNVNLPDSFNLRIKEQNIDIVKKMINRNINTSYGCGIGRLFDAVASLTGITDFTSYQAQAPLKLESIASGNFSDYYEFEESSPLDNSLLISSIINDINSGIHVSDISAKFHNTLARKIFIRSASIIEQYDIPRKVILSGGCFQNKRLTSQVYNLFIKHNIQPYIPSLYPCNDSGISFGQAVILSNIK